MMPSVMRTETFCCGCSPGIAMSVPQWRIVESLAAACRDVVVMMAAVINAK